MSENFQSTIFQFTTKYLYYHIIMFIIQRGTQVFINIVNYIMSFNLHGINLVKWLLKLN